jgi:hypothetical protein
MTSILNMFTVGDWIGLGIALGVTIYVCRAKNPHEKGSPEFESLRLCRVGFALVVWSYGFGLLGYALSLVAFVLGIISIVKGRTAYVSS